MVGNSSTQAPVLDKVGPEDTWTMGGLTRHEVGVVSNNMTELEAPIQPIESGSAIDNRSIDDATKQELMTLLSRNTLVDTFKILTTDNANVLPLSYDQMTYKSYVDGAAVTGVWRKYSFPEAIFNANPIVADKAENFTYMKADVVITLKVNASPFTSGAINVAYTPMWEELKPIHKYSNVTLQGVTSYPNTTLYLDQSDSVELRIPFISPYDNFSLGSSSFQFGQSVITLLTPIRNNDGTAVDVNVFCRFENVDLFVPTNVLINPSTGFQTKKIERVLDAIEEHADSIDISDVRFSLQKLLKKLDLRAQSGPAETEETGIVSGVAGIVGDVADMLSNVPVIDVVAKPVSWIARAVGGVASLFGWSKPVTTEGISIMARVPGYNMLNSEGKETNQSLGLTPDQGIIPHGALFEKDDEMCLDYVLKRQNCVLRETWSDKATAGQLITKVPIKPKYLLGVSQLGSFDYACNLFAKWRGGINYTLSFVKTKFHAGRLAIVYCPSGAPDSLGAMLSTNYNMIIDLNEISSDDGTAGQISMNIPYMVNRPYLDMSVDYKAELGIYVLNPLKQPTGCSDTIDMLWWKSAGVDFELAVPMPQMKIPAWDATSITSVDPQSLSLQAQSGFEDKDRNVYHLVPGQDGHGRLMQAVCTIGERVESLRSLTKRFGKIAQYEGGVTTYPTTASVVMSPRDAVLNLYRFFYGGVRYKTSLQQGDELELRYAATESTDKFVQMQDSEPWGENLTIQGNINNLAEYEIPFYSSTRLRTVGVSEAADKPAAANYAVYSRYAHQKEGLLVPLEQWYLTGLGSDCSVMLTNEQLEKATDDGYVIYRKENGKELVGFQPNVYYDQYLWKWQVKRDKAPPEFAYCTVLAGTPTAVYEANADTAGATFLVAPPVIQRVYYSLF